MPWRLLLLEKTSEFSLPTSCQGMEQLPIIRINSNINYKRYKCKCLCLMQISKCLSGKFYKWRRKPEQGELSQEQSSEAACRLQWVLIKPGCETGCQRDKSECR